MAKTVTQLTVFLASPSDLAPEREMLSSVIDEVNLTVAQYKGLHLNLLKWETHAFPGAGEDPQAVINEQIPQDYDVFVGMLWARFGTPTGRADSGTEEEFQQAYSRYNTSPNSVRIMFYFKDAPLSPSQIDGDQINRVNKFRTSLGEEGVLYWKFKDEEGFASLVRVHLVHQLQSWGSAWGTSDSASEYEQQKGSNGHVPEDEEQPGYLDLVESTEDNLGHATEALGRIVSLVEGFTVDIAAATSGLEEARETRDLKKVYNTVAKKMEAFSVALGEQIEVVAEGQASGMRAFTLAIPIIRDFGTPDRAEIESIKQTMTEYRDGILESKTSTVEFRASVAEQARSTTAFNRAKKRVVESLDRLIAIYDEGLMLASELDKAISDL